MALNIWLATVRNVWRRERPSFRCVNEIQNESINSQAHQVMPRARAVTLMEWVSATLLARDEYGCGLAAAATHLAGSLALTATGMALAHMAMARI